MDMRKENGNYHKRLVLYRDNGKMETTIVCLGHIGLKHRTLHRTSLTLGAYVTKAIRTVLG